MAIPWEDVPEVEAPENLRPGAKLEEKEAYGQLVDVLRSLPQTYRDVMTLRHLQKLPLNQISSITGFSVDYVKKILQRGKKNLRKRWRKWREYDPFKRRAFRECSCRN